MRTGSSRIALLVSVSLLWGVTGRSAQGQQEGSAPSMDRSTWMPVGPLFTQAELDSEFETRRTTPFEDDTLSLSLGVRQSWKWVPLVTGQKSSTERLVPLVRCEADGDPEAAVEVKYVTLTHEVDLRDWIDLFVDSQQTEVLAGQTGNYETESVVDALMRYRDPSETAGEPFVARIGFVKDGNRVFVVSGSARESRFLAHAKEFALAIVSFNLLHPSETRFAEELLSASIETRPPMYFDHPSSWLSSAIDSSEGAVGVDLSHGSSEKPVAAILVRVYDKSTTQALDPEKLAWSFFEEARSGAEAISLDRQALDIEAKSELFERPGRLRVYELTLDGVPLVARLLVLEDDVRWYTIGAIGPSRERTPILWMITKRAFELCCQSLRFER